MGFGLVGTLIATFFAPTEHKAQHELVINGSQEVVWNASLKPYNMTLWMDKLDTVLVKKSDYNQADYQAELVFQENEHTTRVQYSYDSLSAHSYAKSRIALSEKLDLFTSFTILPLDSNQVKLIAETVLIPKSWFYRVMLSGSGDGLTEKRGAELKNIKMWVENQLPQE